MQKRKNFTLIELLVVIAMIAILAGMLLPALNKAREKGKQAACISLFKQFGYAFRMYLDDNKDWLPPIRDYGSPEKFLFSLEERSTFLGPYLMKTTKNQHIGLLSNSLPTKFVCPSASIPSGWTQTYTYAINNHFYNVGLGGADAGKSLRYTSFKKPSVTLFMGEVQMENNFQINYFNPLTSAGNASALPMYFRHSGSSVVLHGDMHVRSYVYRDIPFRPGGYLNLFWWPNP